MDTLSYNDRYELGNHDPKSALAYAPTHTTLGYCERLFTMHYVYFITDGEYIKIGISNNVASRFHALRTSNPKPLEILHTIECKDSFEAHGMERNLHKLFKDFRAAGEWFKIEWATIQAKLEMAEQNIEAPKPEIIKVTFERKESEPIQRRERFGNATPSKICQTRFDAFVKNDLLYNYPKMQHSPNLGTDIDEWTHFVPKQWDELSKNFGKLTSNN